MKVLIPVIAGLGLLSFFLLKPAEINIELPDYSTIYAKHKLADKAYPNEQYFIQRSYPDFTFNTEAFEAVMADARLAAATESGFGLSWTQEGPNNIGGRINTIAIDPTDNNIIYMGTCNGGIWKTTDRGASWAPIFDDANYLAIGDIEIDPNNSSVIYAGTGDPNVSGYPHLGDGLYKSTDAGATWINIGLANDRIVSRVEVHPTNSNIIYASTMGLPMAPMPDRGLYKSTDGGSSWNQVLFLSDSTGVIDFVVHPTNPDIVYAAGWDRIRNNQQSLISGQGAKIYKTTNGGTSWTTLIGGLPTTDESRISLEMSSSNPDLIYALYVDDSSLDVEGIYKTTNGGVSWTMTNNPGAVQGGFGWYFDGLKINPYDDDEIYVLGVDMFRSDDGGTSWNQVVPDWWTYQVHADKHDLVWMGPDTILLATDGGAYITEDDCASWDDFEDFPHSQFYHVSISPHEPGVYYGGMQDNGTSGGNAAIINSWPRIYGGDGFHPDFHPTNPNVMYAETQNGGIVVSTNSGASFSGATSGISGSDRENWDMPYIVSVHGGNVMYTGTYRLYKSSGSIVPSWSAISPDLTDGIIYGANYHTITTIRESNIDAQTIYVGTSDGNVQRTTNGGASWTDVTGTLPDRYITDLETSKLNENIVFVTLSGYKDNDFTPHIFMSSDKGDSWTPIQGDLPNFAINDMETTGLNDSLLFVATDGGVYFTLNQGTSWERLGDNMPLFNVYDIEIDNNINRLAAATFARGIYSIPIDTFYSLYSITATAFSDVDTICQGDAAQLTATGGATYNWTPGTGLSCTSCSNPVATPVANTVYVVEVSNGVVSDYDTVKVYVSPSPATPAIVQSGDTLYANPGPGYAYQWFAGGSLISGANDSIYLPPANDESYQVEITTPFGCDATSFVFDYDYQQPVDTSIGIKPLTTSQISVYPNPASKLLQFSISGLQYSGATTYGIYNTAGELLLEQQTKQLSEQVNVSGLPRGLYILKLESEIFYGQQLFIKL